MILDGLIEQTIAFLEGRGSVPYVHGAIDDETVELVPMLVQVNRHGLVTTCSQPGVPMQTYVWQDGSRHEAIQRSFLTGMCTGVLARFLHDQLNGTDMVIVARPLAQAKELDAIADMGTSWVVTWLDGKPLTRAGHWIDELAQWERGVSPRVYAGIARECWAVAIMDPVWGRSATHSDGLLRKVIKALTSKERPSG